MIGYDLKMTKLKVVSLFSGVGGLDWGFYNNPQFFELVFANDFNHEACNTYRANFKEHNHLHEGDIKLLFDKIPKHDLLIGGFPCQPFSLAGLRKGFEDQRGLEIYSVAWVLKEHQPSFFILENVKGILSHNKGETLQTILSLLNDLGYNTEYKLFKMHNYGIPQRRERVLFFGVRKDLTIEPKSLIPTDKALTAPSLNRILKYVETNCQFGEKNHNLHISTKVKQHWFNVLKEGENLNHLTTEEILQRETSLNLEHRIKPRTMMGYRRLNGEEIAPTMMFGNTCLPIHPTENRNLSVRECATIQSFPISFVFKGGITSQYKQVGNAVPPLFSKILAETIINVVKSVSP
jgi:DNA (cytosine-5)-methyltransferase 1